MSKPIRVEIVMGSKSDLEKVKPAAIMLKDLGIPCRVSIYSAHRTLTELIDFIHSDINVVTCEGVIAAAGMSAALAGIIAAETLKPVIALPLSGGKYKGIEAVLASMEMPPGNPVPTVGIDAAKNAALSMARIIANHDEEVYRNLSNFKSKQKEAVLADNAELQTTFTFE